MNTIQIDPQWIQIGGPALLTGLLLGALIAWLILRSQKRQLGDDIRLLETRIKDQEALQVERDSAYDAATTRLATSFSELANKSLKSNSDNFLRLAKENLGAQQELAKRDLGERELAVENLVKPIRDALQQSQKQIDELEKSRSEAYGSIKSHLESMQSSQKSLTRETQNLVNALRRPEVRGRWGEMTLKRLVELSGMVEHCDFQEQVHTSTGDKIIRPDMVIHMPNKREVVVDVKTPLDAYIDATEAKDDTQRNLGLKRHAANVRKHVSDLSKKSYWDQFPQSPEFVILFIPGDQFLSAALNEDPDLIDSALSQKIVLATPTSFLALLKVVAHGWQQLALADNAEEIRQLASDLYGRLGTFVSHLNKVGKQLNSSVDNYNKAVGSLERNVLPGARKFVELGIRPKKEIEQIESLESLPRTLVEPQKDGDDESGDKTLQ
jgi:DNA recombination protein RmuC